MLPYAATLVQASFKRSFGERSKNRRSKTPVRTEKKAARRRGRLEIEREIIEAKAAEVALAAEEKLWQEQMLEDEQHMLDLVRDEEQEYWDVWDPYDDCGPQDDETEHHLPYDPYEDNDYYDLENL